LTFDIKYAKLVLVSKLVLKDTRRAVPLKKGRHPWSVAHLYIYL